MGTIVRLELKDKSNKNIVLMNGKLETLIKSRLTSIDKELFNEYLKRAKEYSNNESSTLNDEEIVFSHLKNMFKFYSNESIKIEYNFWLSLDKDKRCENYRISEILSDPNTTFKSYKEFYKHWNRSTSMLLNNLGELSFYGSKGYEFFEETFTHFLIHEIGLDNLNDMSDIDYFFYDMDNYEALLIMNSPAFEKRYFKELVKRYNEDVRDNRKYGAFKGHSVKMEIYQVSTKTNTFLINPLTRRITETPL